MNSPLKTRLPKSRAGFSLLELLIVIGIIAFLTTLTIISMGGAGTSARENATRATILKITTMLNERKQAFGRLSFKEVIKNYNLDENNPADRILAKKYEFKRVFAQYANEARDNSITNGTNDAESSENLYRILMNGDTFGTPNPGTDSFKEQEVGDTDGDGNLEFLDGWGRPLRFYRWPTRLVRPKGGTNATNPNGILNLLMSSVPAKLDEDPDDPLGRIANTTSSGSIPQYQTRNSGGTLVATNASERQYHTYNTWHTMLIVSAGEDGELGLHEPWDIDKYGHLAEPTADATIDRSTASATEIQALDTLIEQLADNITNLQQDQ